jgi:DNA polymerase
MEALTMIVRRRTKESHSNSLIPEGATIPALREAAQSCRGCDLYKNATQAVFGEGAAPSRAMLVGEQPGDQEDLQGHPFIGPAGRLLRAVMEEVGLSAADVYITNAVKHFKWEPRGARRIHKKPAYGEVVACKPWLLAETRLVRPSIIVCLGATAAQAFLGSNFRLTENRGRFLEAPGLPRLMPTLHPSAVLRMPTDEDKQRARADLASDLARVRDLLDREAKAPSGTGLPAGQG